MSKAFEILIRLLPQAWVHHLVEQAISASSGNKGDVITLIRHIVEDQKPKTKDLLDYSNMGKIESFFEKLQPNLRFNFVL